MFPRDLRQPSSFYYTNISERHLLLCVTTAVVSLMLHDCVYGLFLFLHLYLFHLLFLFLVPTTTEAIAESNNTETV